MSSTATRHRVLALISGGKDSCYNAQLCLQYNHELVCLGNLYPSDTSVEELDSYMYQTVGHSLVEAYAQCTGLPLLRKKILGASVEVGLVYHGDDRAADHKGGRSTMRTPYVRDEVEDLEVLLRYAKDKYEITAVSSGAIASDYQRSRVERICSKLSLTSLAYLWHIPQSSLLREMIMAGVDARLVKVAGCGLVPRRDLMKGLGEMEGRLTELRKLYGSNVCGEGGEYETLTLDCGWFGVGLVVVDAWEVVEGEGDGVGWVRVVAWHVEGKLNEVGEGVVIEVPDDYVEVGGEGGEGGEHECEGERLGGRARCQDPLSVVVDLEVNAPNRNDKAVCDVTSSSASSSDITTFHGHCDSASTFEDLLYALQDLMESHGFCIRTQCVFVTLFVEDMSRFGELNAVYARHFPPVNPPSRATLEKVGKGVSIQVQCSSKPRSVLHVQSLSRWAPSCIGPYSQAVSCGGLVRYSGQIALAPETSVIEVEGIEGEVARVRRTCDLLGEAMKLEWASTLLWSVLYVDGSWYPDEVLRRLLTREDDREGGDELGDVDESDETDNSYVEEYLMATKNDRSEVRAEAMTLVRIELMLDQVLGHRPSSCLLSRVHSFDRQVVKCPHLPRNAKIEIQSVHAGIESLLYEKPASSSDDEEIATQAAAQAEHGWLRHLSYLDADGSLRMRAVYAPGKFAKVNMVSMRPACEGVGGADIANAVVPVLAAAGLTTDDLAVMSGYVVIDEASQDQDQDHYRARQALQDALIEAFAAPAFVVSVLGVSLFGNDDGNFAIELFFCS